MSYRLLALSLSLLPILSAAQGVVYRCPGPPILYTDALSAKEAASKGCRAIEDAPVTVVQAARPKLPPTGSLTSSTSGLGGNDSARIDALTQRARDSDRRAVLQAELTQAEKRMADLRTEYNNGNPERAGDERNFAKYQERLAELKAQLARQESDVQAIRRELGKVN